MIYKGKLQVRKEDTQKLKIASEHEYSSLTLSPQLKKLFESLDVENKTKIYNYIKTLKSGITLVEDEPVKQALNKAINTLNIEENSSSTDILYSEAEINGIMYGRELFTGFCFPLFIIGNGIDCNYLVNVKTDFDMNHYGGIPDVTFINEYELERTLSIDIPDIPLCTTFISPKSLANNNEISEYLTKLNCGIFHRKREELFRKKITTLYNSNAYADTFPEKHSIGEVTTLRKAK